MFAQVEHSQSLFPKITLIQAYKSKKKSKNGQKLVLFQIDHLLKNTQHTGTTFD